MAVVLKIDTKSSLHEPLEVDIDGVLLQVKPVSLASLELIQSLDEAMNAGSAKAIRQALEAIIDGDIGPVLNLPLSKVQEIVTLLVEKSIKAGTEEKNGSGPGGK